MICQILKDGCYYVEGEKETIKVPTIRLPNQTSQYQST